MIAWLLSLTMRPGQRYTDWRWRRIAAYVRRRAGNRCEWCERRGMLHVHHIRPVFAGGSHHPRNLAALCVPCHERLHGRDLNRDGKVG